MSRELIRNIIHACRDRLLSPDAATNAVLAIVKKIDGENNGASRLDHSGNSAGTADRCDLANSKVRTQPTNAMKPR